MNDKQFKKMMDKLEEIRCGLIDIEGLVEKGIKPNYDIVVDVLNPTGGPFIGPKTAGKEKTIPHLIKNVELVEIREGDGAQLYSFGPFEADSLWLMGWNCAEGVQVGDKGRLEYKKGQHGSCEYGLWFFIKDES